MLDRAWAGESWHMSTAAGQGNDGAEGSDEEESQHADSRAASKEGASQGRSASKESARKASKDTKPLVLFGSGRLVIVKIALPGHG